MKMMKIRQYVNYTMVFCLLAWGSQFLTGCAESDHLDEYQYDNTPKEPGDPEKPTSDEIESEGRHLQAALLSEVQGLGSSCGARYRGLCPARLCSRDTRRARPGEISESQLHHCGAPLFRHFAA